MNKEYPLSTGEEKAINSLGGFQHVAGIADRVLAQHGFHRGLFTRSECEQIRRGRRRNRAIEFHFDSAKSLRANIENLFAQAAEIQPILGGPNYVGAMLQHLVGAKLDLVLGEGKIEHHGFSVADAPTGRQADFEVETVAIHVTTSPTESLVTKCAENLQGGLKPLIITVGDGVDGAEFLLKNSQLVDRVDVLDAAQFLTANVYERSLFKAAECKVTLTGLLQRYNAIIAFCENDPVLVIKFRSPAPRKKGSAPADTQG